MGQENAASPFALERGSHRRANNPNFENMLSIEAKPYPFKFDLNKAALLCIDYQGDFLLDGGVGTTQGADLDQIRKVLPTSVRLLRAARAAGLTVIHTREGHAADLSDLPTSKRYRQAHAPGSTSTPIGDKGPSGERVLVRGEKMHDIVDEMKPALGELVIDKPGKGAFYATELHQLLVNRQISHLFIIGLTTECCVMTTFREAADRGFECAIVSDAVAGYVPDFAKASLDMSCYADGLWGYLTTSDALIPTLDQISTMKRTPESWDGSLDVETLTTLYRADVITPVQVIEEVYHRISLPTADPAVWLALFKREAVLEEARALAAAYPDASARPPLFGIPYSIKDSIDVKDVETTGACPDFAYTATEDAPSVTMLKAAGALAIGKVNLDQLATGLVGMRSPYGQPASVFSKKHVSGGSSSGSCVSVASHQVSFSLATDTAGSGRVPAAFNGIVGFKPTRGTINMEGVIPCCLSLDCLAVEALTVADAKRVWDVLYGIDDTLPFAKVARPPWALAPRAVLQPDEDFTFAVPPRESESRALVTDEFNDLFDEAVKRVSSIGGKLCESLDYTVFEHAGRLLYEGSFVAERVSGVKEWFDSHPKPTTEGEKDSLLPEIRTIYDAANNFKATTAWEDARQQMISQRRTAKEFAKGFQVLVVPTAPIHPTKEAYNADPIALNHRLGKFTHYANILDMTGVSVPAGFTKDGMPFAITILGQSFTDGLVLEIAKRFEANFAHPAGSPKLP